MRFTKVWFTVYDGTGDDAAAKAAADKAAADAAAAGGTPKTFTQDDVNRLLAKEKRDAQTKQQKLVEELEALKTSANLTAEERTALETRIENLRQEYMTKEELTKREKDKLKKDMETSMQTLTTERDGWKNRYTDATIMRNITDAAAENKAYRPQQIVAILRSTTRLVEALDGEGKPTGELIPKVTLSDVDKDGKSVTLDLSVKDAVKRMREMGEYANLFVGEGTGGVGGQNRSGGGPVGSLANVATDPAKYREARRKGLI